MKIKLLLCGLLLSSMFWGCAASKEAKLAEHEEIMDDYLAKDQNIEKFQGAFRRYAENKQKDQAKFAVEQEKKELEENLKNPIKVDIAGSPAKGDKNAPVTIVIFSDFQCPFCKRGADTMKELEKEYAGKIRFAFKNLPLDFHPNAKPAAKAALAAGEQGKFWEMHDAIFENQESLGDKLYPELAKKLGLKLDKFRKDMQSKKLEEKIKKDTELAGTVGINGTPGFVVNGVRVSGARDAQYFKSVIDAVTKQEQKK